MFFCHSGCFLPLRVVFDGLILKLQAVLSTFVMFFSHYLVVVTLEPCRRGGCFARLRSLGALPKASTFFHICSFPFKFYCEYKGDGYLIYLFRRFCLCFSVFVLKIGVFIPTIWPSPDPPSFSVSSLVTGFSS